MKISISLFAAGKQLAGKNETEVELPANAAPTIGSLRVALRLAHPELRALLEASAFAVDHEYAMEDTMLNETSHVALIPPVSGG